MKYNPPHGVEDEDAGYVNGDPSQGIKGSIIPAEAVEYTQREIVNLIDKGGFLPDNEDLFQLTRGVRGAKFAYGQDTGSANSLSVALDPPLLAYAEGLEVRVRVASDNSAASTIRINGLNTQQIVHRDGTPLLSGDLRAGGIAVLVYDGTNFQLVSGAGGDLIFEQEGWFNGADYIVDIGTPNVLAGTPPIAPTSYAAGQSFLVLVKNTNTGPCTINVNSLGAKPIVLPTGQPLGAGDIIPNMLIRISFDGFSFFMLSSIDRAIISTALSFIVGPNPSPAPHFSDLHKAMMWLSRRRIDKAGSVLITLQGQGGGSPVVHQYTSSVALGHPDGERLTIAGPQLNFLPSPGSFVCNSATSAQIPADANSNIAMLRTAFQTELQFTGTIDGVVVNGGRCTLKNILVTGNTFANGGPATSGIHIISGAAVNVEQVASAFWGRCWNIETQSQVLGSNVYAVGGSYNGFNLGDQSTILFGSQADSPTTMFITAQTYLDGLQIGHSSTATILCRTSRPRVYGNMRDGVNLFSASAMEAPMMMILWSGSIGCRIAGRSALQSDGSIISQTGNAGFYASFGGMANVYQSQTSSVAAGDYVAGQGSYIFAQGFGNPGAQFSPPRNTVGNGNSYIEA